MDKLDKLALEAFLYSADFGEDHYLLASSSSSSNSDSECCCSEDSDSTVEKFQLKRPKVEGFAEVSVPLLSDTEFKSNFRVSKATCEKVTELIYDDFYSDRKGGWEKITPTKAAYVLLWYLGSQETFKQISDRFRITQSCVHNIVRVGCRNLMSRLSQFIKWPERERYDEESNAFYNLSKISGTIGAVAVSHFKVLKPRSEHEKYNNMKNYHSIAVQGLVGSNRNFIDLFICEGSLEDYQILDKSLVPTKFGEDVMEDYFLVGYKSFPATSWLVTPFPMSQSLIPLQDTFNHHLSLASDVAREAFAALKGRFQRLGRFENKDVSFVTRCVQAACVVHNLCLENGDEWGEFEEDAGIFECDFEFEGEDDERREQAFEAFISKA